MKKIRPPKLVTVSVFTTVTIIFWIFFGVYTVLTTDAEVDVDQELLKSINPNLDTQVLDELPEKKFYDSSFNQTLTITRQDGVNSDEEETDETGDETDEENDQQVEVEDVEEDETQTEAQTEDNTQ